MMKNIGSKYCNSKLTNVRDGDTQPNAVDVRLDRVFIFEGTQFTLSDDEKEHSKKYEIEPDRTLTGDWFSLAPDYYEVIMENQVSLFKEEEVPFGDTGLVIARSTLIRNGVYLVSGLYDSGYSGPIVAGLHVTNGIFKVKRGTRIGQFLLFFAEADHKYNGSYGT